MDFGGVQQQEICRFFNSPSGCARGRACIYRHVKVRALHLHLFKLQSLPLHGLHG